MKKMILIKLCISEWHGICDEATNHVAFYPFTNISDAETWIQNWVKDMDKMVEEGAATTDGYYVYDREEEQWTLEVAIVNLNQFFENYLNPFEFDDDGMLVAGSTVFDGLATFLEYKQSFKDEFNR